VVEDVLNVGYFQFALNKWDGNKMFEPTWIFTTCSTEHGICSGFNSSANIIRISLSTDKEIDEQTAFTILYYDITHEFMHYILDKISEGIASKKLDDIPFFKIEMEIFPELEEAAKKWLKLGWIIRLNDKKIKWNGGDK